MPFSLSTCLSMCLSVFLSVRLARCLLKGNEKPCREKNEFQRYRGYDTDCCSVYRNTVPLKTRFCKIMFSHKIEHACVNHSCTRVSIMHASKRAGPRRRTLSVTPPRPCAPAPPRPRAPNLNVERDLRVEAHDSKAARPTEPSTLRLGARGYSRDSWGWEYGVPEF